MKIFLVLVASLVAVACGHNNDGGSYSAKKADKVSFKESLIEKIHNIKDKIHAKIASKKEKVHAKKAQKHLTFDKGASPAADCSTVLDEVWEEQCGTKYESSCRMEMQPHCTSIQAKECAPESQTRCSFVFEDKCKTISVPKCTIDWEKRCTSTPDCTTIEAKSCTDVEKDVCVTHMDKTCTMSTVNVCRKVAVRESTPVVDTAEEVGLKASIKAKAAAHKALKAQKKAEKIASKGHTIYKRSPGNEDNNEDDLDSLWPPNVGYTNPGTGKPCVSPYFTCDDNKCHQMDKWCDDKIDCQDEYDEVNNKCNYHVDRHNSSISDYEDYEDEEPELVDPPTTTTKKPEVVKCDAACTLKEAYDKCELDIAVLTIADDKRIKDNNLAQEFAIAGGHTDPVENELRYPTKPRDFGNCDRLRPKKPAEDLLKDVEKELQDVIRQLETCKQEQKDEIDRQKRLQIAAKIHLDDYAESLDSDDDFLPSERVGRNTRSVKNDADFKGNLATFKAGLQAAKAQYKDAKAQFKATTKALFHAKLNKGPKGEKGLKASAPTIRVRYEKSCQDEPRKVCTNTPRQVCHKENVPLCKSEPRETCVQREKCKSWPTKNCGMVHKETCLPFPTKKCTEVSTPVCKIVPRQECTEKKREICETVPTKDCQKVLVTKPRTVCIPRPTTRTIEDW